MSKYYSIHVQSRYTRSVYVRDVLAKNLRTARTRAIAEVIATRGGWPSDYRIIGHTIRD